MIIKTQIELNNAMDLLHEHIMNTNYEEKIKDAVLHGNNRCTLYEFKNGQTFHNFPLIFLTRGPPFLNNSVGGFQYFEQNNFKIHSNNSYDTVIDIILKE